MIRKALTLLFLGTMFPLFVSTIFTSCNDCGGWDIETEVFSLENIEASLKTIFPQQNTNGSGVGVSVLMGVEDLNQSGIRYDSLGIELAFDYVRIASRRPSVTPWGFSGLMACSPPSPTSFTEVITSINVYSDQDYQVAYPAGESLNDLVEIHVGISLDGLPIDEFLATASPGSESIIVSLALPPDERNTQELTIEIGLDDGRNLSIVTDPIEIWE